MRSPSRDQHCWLSGLSVAELVANCDCVVRVGPGDGGLMACCFSTGGSNQLAMQ